MPFGMGMVIVDIFFTVDVEVWCKGWRDLESSFPRAFQHYVYGNTSRGNFGLPYTLRELGEHGLRGIFFVEPLFAARFGMGPLSDIVDLILDAKQEIQLHLHTEWVDEAKTPLLPKATEKRQYLSYFSLDEQSRLIAAGLQLLRKAGADCPNAFRAGSFALNQYTLPALYKNNIFIDSSYNAVQFGLNSGVASGKTLVEPEYIDGVYEYPVTVFSQGYMSLRPAQITACSFKELEYLLWRSLESGRSIFVLVSHSFELLNSRRDRPDSIVVNRFRRLCQFLDQNRDCFTTRGFHNLDPWAVNNQPGILSVPRWATGLRMIEQILRRRYR